MNSTTCMRECGGDILWRLGYIVEVGVYCGGWGILWSVGVYSGVWGYVGYILEAVVYSRACGIFWCLGHTLEPGVYSGAWGIL